MAVTKTIPAGLINKPVIFKQPASSLNDEGGKEVTYSSEITTRAAVSRFNEYRATEVDGVSLIGALDFTIRYRSAADTVTKDWLIEYQGNDYVIHVIEFLDQEKRFIRFTGKSKGTAVVSSNGSAVGDYPSGSGGGSGDIDMSNLKLSFNSTTGFSVVVYIEKNTEHDESFIDWGDGTTEVVAEGTILSGAHTYAAGQYDCKAYPLNGVTIPTAQAVNLIRSVNVTNAGEDPTDVVMTVGDSLSKCDYMKSFEAQNWNMTTFPTLPNATPGEKVSTVDIPGSNLNGVYCSNIYEQCDDIGWPVGYIDLTDSPGVSSLSAAGLLAKQSLTAKGWTLLP